VQLFVNKYYFLNIKFNEYRLKKSLSVAFMLKCIVFLRENEFVFKSSNMSHFRLNLVFKTLEPFGPKTLTLLSPSKCKPKTHLKALPPLRKCTPASAGPVTPALTPFQLPFNGNNTIVGSSPPLLGFPCPPFLPERLPLYEWPARVLDSPFTLPHHHPVSPVP